MCTSELHDADCGCCDSCQLLATSDTRRPDDHPQISGLCSVVASEVRQQLRCLTEMVRLGKIQAKHSIRERVEVVVRSWCAHPPCIAFSVRLGFTPHPNLIRSGQWRASYRLMRPDRALDQTSRADAATWSARAVESGVCKTTVVNFLGGGFSAHTLVKVFVFTPRSSQA